MMRYEAKMKKLCIRNADLINRRIKYEKQVTEINAEWNGAFQLSLSPRMEDIGRNSLRQGQRVKEMRLLEGDIEEIRKEEQELREKLTLYHFKMGCAAKG